VSVFLFAFVAAAAIPREMSRSMAFICEHLRASLLLREQFGVSSALASTLLLRYLIEHFGISSLSLGPYCEDHEIARGICVAGPPRIVVKSTSTARASSSPTTV
jgi:hypothetical protein